MSYHSIIYLSFYQVPLVFVNSILKKTRCFTLFFFYCGNPYVALIYLLVRSVPCLFFSCLDSLGRVKSSSIHAWFIKFCFFPVFLCLYLSWSTRFRDDYVVQYIMFQFLWRLSSVIFFTISLSLYFCSH